MATTRPSKSQYRIDNSAFVSPGTATVAYDPATTTTIYTSGSVTVSLTDLEVRSSIKGLYEAMKSAIPTPFLTGDWVFVANEGPEGKETLYGYEHAIAM